MTAFLAATPAQAIVGGQESAAPLAREAVMVLSSKGGMCSAVIVAADVVLTAGHCAAGAGQHRVHWRGEDGAPELVEPAAKAIHPGYDAKAVEARRRSIDLALIRLPQNLPDRFAVAKLSAANPSAPARVTFGGYGVAKEGDARSSGTFRTAELPVAEPYGRSTILDLGRGRRARRRLHGRFRRAGGARRGGVRDHHLGRRQEERRLRQVLARRAPRPAAGVDRPHARGVGAQGEVGVAPPLPEGEVVHLDENPRIPGPCSPEGVDNRSE